VLENLDLEIAFLPGDVPDLAQGQQLDIDVPADLDQFRGQDSHGAVIGGEGLV